MIGPTPFCPMCGAAKSTDKCSRCGADMKALRDGILADIVEHVEKIGPCDLPEDSAFLVNNIYQRAKAALGD